MAEPSVPNAGGPPPEGPAPETPPPPARPKLIDAVIDLLETVRDWVRQELGDAVHDKVAVPLQRVGVTIGSAFAAGCLLVVGLIFVAIALLLILAKFLTWPGALGLIGAVFLIGAAIFLYVKSRSMVR
ncbi:MAG TPA: phage holin family protein [Coriobacteriia bacterium]